MFKFVVVIFALIACIAAKPGHLHSPLAYTAPAAVIAAPGPFVTATSNQVFARNYNGIAAAPIVAAAPVAPIVKTTHLAAQIATPFAAPLAYSLPLTYSTAGAPLLW